MDGVIIREYTEADLPQMMKIWNEVVRVANAFPQEEELTLKAAKDFFATQSHTGVAQHGDRLVGLYILHPNNIGRCGHIANASYAVKSDCRGLHIGEALVCDSLAQGRELGFRILQFNAVVADNAGAIRLYERLGFERIGIVRGGFRAEDGAYQDIVLFYIEL